MNMIRQGFWSLPFTSRFFSFIFLFVSTLSSFSSHTQLEATMSEEEILLQGERDREQAAMAQAQRDMRASIALVEQREAALQNLRQRCGRE